MTLPATDAFTGADGTALTTYSANWTLNNGNFAITSNSVRSNAADDNLAHWNADTFNADQYSQATVPARDSTYGGVAVRCHASAFTGYFVHGNLGDTNYLIRYVNGAGTILVQGGATIAVNDLLRLEAEGTTIRPLRNGAAWLTAQTDSNIASGYAGIAGYGTGSTGVRLDDWEGGNLAGAADPEGSLIGGKLLRGGLLMHGVLVGSR